MMTLSGKEHNPFPLNKKVTHGITKFRCYPRCFQYRGCTIDFPRMIHRIVQQNVSFSKTYKHRMIHPQSQRSTVRVYRHQLLLAKSLVNFFNVELLCQLIGRLRPVVQSYLVENRRRAPKHSSQKTTEVYGRRFCPSCP